MANTITSQVISKGPKTITIKVDILGDGSGDIVPSTTIINYTDYTDTPPSVIDLLSLQSTMYGFTARLDSNQGFTKKPIISISPNSPGISVRNSTTHSALPMTLSTALGGGTIKMTTYGLGANDHGTLVFSLRLDAS